MRATTKSRRVSVVLPVCNGERYIVKALQSILEQTLSEFELIVIDDGSHDATPGHLAAWASRDSRVHVVSRSNRGLTYTLNEGLQLASCEYVAIMNADDVSRPERLERQATYLDAHLRVAAVGSQTRLLDEAGNVGPASSLPLSPSAVRAFMVKASPLAHPSVMVRRSAVIAIGGYRPQMEPAEDYDLWLRLAERHDLANLPDVLLEYRVHSGQVTSAACEAVAMATLVAQAAARCRAAGTPDPVEHWATLDRGAVAALGVTEFDSARQAIDTALSRAESVLAAGGSVTVARETLAALAGLASSVGADRPWEAAGHWLEGRILMRQGCRAAALRSLMRAALVEPSFRSRLAWAVTRRLTERRPSK